MSSRRAYRPAQSTFDLRDRVRDLPWVDKVEIEAPHTIQSERTGSITRASACFWVTDRSGVQSHLSFAQARLLTGPEPHRCHGVKTDGDRCSRFIRGRGWRCWEHR